VTTKDIRKSLLGGAAWAFGGKLASILFGFLLNLILARTLSASDYGTYFVIINTIIITASVGALGLDQVVVRFTAGELALGNLIAVRRIAIRCLVLASLGGAAAALALWCATPWLFGKMLSMPGAVPLAGLVFAWSVLATAQRQIAETFRGLHRIGAATFFNGLRSNGVIISVLTFVLTFLAAKAWQIRLRDVLFIAVVSSACVTVIAAVVLCTTLMRLGRHDGTAVAEDSMFSTSRALHEAWPIWLAMTIAMLREQGVGWFAGASDTSSQVALFGVAQRLVLLMTIPLFVINTVLPPVVAGLFAKGEVERMGRVVRTASGLASIPCLLALLVLILGGKILLSTLFGSYYESSYGLVLILCVGYVADIVTGSWQVVLPMTGLRKQTIFVSAIAAVVQISACLLGGRLAGVYGVSYGLVVGMIVGNACGLFVVRRYLGIWTFVAFEYKYVTEIVAIIGRKSAESRSRRSVNKA